MPDNDSLSRSIYCRTEADLFTDPARLLIYRFCKPWLEQKQVSVAELFHSTSLQNQFVSAGAFYSNAVQKVSIVQVEISKAPVQTRVKELYALCDNIMAALRQDLFAGKPAPAFNEKNFQGYVEAVRGIISEPFNQDFAIRKAIASYIALHTNFEMKIKTLIDLLDTTPGTDHNSYVDMFIGDAFLSGQAIKELLGDTANSLYERLVEFIDLYKGQYNKPENPYITRLCQTVHQTQMPITKRTIEEHLLNTLQMNGILLSNDLVEELHAIVDILNRLKVKDSYIGGDEIEQIIFARVSGVVNAETLTLYTKDITDREEKLRKLMDVYTATPGAKNKRAPMTIIERMMEEWSDRVDARGNTDPTLETLKTIGSIAKAIKSSDMPDSKQEKLLNQIKKIYDSISPKISALDKIEKGPMGLVEKTLQLLDLIKHNAFMDKDMMKAKAMAKNLIKDPSFLESYIKDGGETSQAEQKKRLMELLKLFADCGISAT